MCAHELTVIRLVDNFDQEQIVSPKVIFTLSLYNIKTHLDKL